ncbi:MaoC family dehydratase [Zavarzinia sp. CC-PAN008]|uniref:MaoC family dehydratase n=1 Tax=Zavarzinia sp. CC-PAN008 TaxID=3243332 RepID=UPI003F7456AD
MARLHFEDFEPGSVLWTEPRTVTAEEIIAFASEWDPQPMHVDPVAAAKSYYGGLIASGWHTCAITMRMMCEGWILNAASAGSPGVDEVKWKGPLRAGDTIRLRRDVLDARPSQSRPQIGLVHMTCRVFNQRDEEILEMRSTGMFYRKVVA